MMGGSIEVHSVEGAGSTFRFTIPAEAVESIPGGPSEEHPRPTAKLRVLVAGDNRINQLVVVRLLEKMGVEVMVAQDGEQAVALATGDVFDLAFMDVQMPGTDGLEATRRIRASGGDAASLPIVALTAHASQKDAERCYAAGMNDYLTKPVTSATLFGAIEKWVLMAAVNPS
jgi:CheY-like chemotaxis protein